MRTMNSIMSDATNENISLVKKRSIIYGALCCAILFTLWIPTLVLIAMFTEFGSIVGATYGAILMVGTPWTMILALNYSSTYDYLKHSKNMDKIHNRAMADMEERNKYM